MDWTSWSRTWSTQSTTTTSRRPLRRSRKNLHWQRMYLLFASRSKAKAKPRRLTSACSSTTTEPICERNWTDIEPGTQSPIAYPLSKQLSTLLRHGQLPREEDGAIEFWRLRDHVRNDFENSQHWSDEMWKSKMQGGGGNEKRFQYCTDPSGQEVLYLRAAESYQTRSNAIILYGILPAFCIPKVVMMESGEIIYEKVYASLRLPPKISFKNNWMKELDSAVAGSSKDTQRIQPKPKTKLSRTERPVGEQPPGLLNQEIGKDVLVGCESTNSRTGETCESTVIQRCVPVSVERVDKDKDADENDDADPTRTESEWTTNRFVHSAPGNWHVRIATCSCETSRELSRPRAREKYRESSASRSTASRLAAKYVYNPFSDNSKAMFREMGNAE